MMLGNENDIIHACEICIFDPLVGIDFSGGIRLNGKCAIRPFEIIKSIDAEMDKHSEFAIHHILLTGSRHKGGWLGNKLWDKMIGRPGAINMSMKQFFTHSFFTTTF